jgi:hypothetical protein
MCQGFFPCPKIWHVFYRSQNLKNPCDSCLKPRFQSACLQPFSPMSRKIKDGSGWCVLVLWPSGLEQHVPGFRSLAEAEQWIVDESETWLKRHPRNQYA